MNLISLELLKEGANGVIVTYQEPRQSGKYTIIDTVSRTCNTPATSQIKLAMKRLKYYFLTATGYWEHGWTKWLSDDFLTFKKDVTVKKDEFGDRAKAEMYMRETTISKISFKNGKFYITGVIDLNEKMIKPKYQPITESDNLGIYYDLLDFFGFISDAAASFVETDRLPMDEVKEMLSLLAAKDKQEEIVGLTENESHEEMIAELERRGCVVIAPEGFDDKISQTPATKEEAVEAKETMSTQDMANAIVSQHMEDESDVEAPNDEKKAPEQTSDENPIEKEFEKKGGKITKAKKVKEIEVPIEAESDETGW